MIHFVGIGGIGMSGLAQLFLHEGKQVQGSDREESPTTELLRSKGATVLLGHDAVHVTEEVSLVVYSDAVPEDNPERVRARELGIPEQSYFQALGAVSLGKRTVAVAGTHGKTTTTGMLARILHDSGASPSAIVGSIVRDFESNFLAGESDLFVVEACEYRDHVLELAPEILVITNLEYDHTDFFPSLPALQETFKKAINRVPADGAIVTNPNDPNIAPLLESAAAQVVDYTAEDVPGLRLIGEFNRDNARAAKAAARVASELFSDERANASLADYRGSWRRFEYKGKTAIGAAVYDDYAHHPTAIAKTIAAVREQFPEKRIVVAFHPHLYSRTRDLFDGFVSSLALADEAIIAPIYAAREAHDPAVAPEKLAEAVSAAGGQARAASSLDVVGDMLGTVSDDSLIVTMGAGDIYKIADRLVK